MGNEVRENFRTYLNEAEIEEPERWIGIIDFNLKALLQAVGKLKECQGAAILSPSTQMRILT